MPRTVGAGPPGWHGYLILAEPWQRERWRSARPAPGARWPTRTPPGACAGSLPARANQSHRRRGRPQPDPAGRSGSGVAVRPLSRRASQPSRRKPGFPGQFVRSSSLSRLADKCRHARQGQHCPEAKVLDNRAERQPAAKRPRRRVRRCRAAAPLARRPRVPVIDPRGSAGRCIRPLTAAGSPEGPYRPVGTGYSGQPWSIRGSCVTGARARLRPGPGTVTAMPSRRRRWLLPVPQNASPAAIMVA